MAGPVLIIGATGGIGRALTRRLAAAKQPMFLVARHRDTLEPLAQEVGAGFAVADVLDEQALRGAVAESAGAGEGLSGLAYCVGSIVVKPFKAAKTDEYIEAFRLNALGAATAVHAARDSLSKGHGSVVLFSTVAVQQGFSNHTVISTAKGAVEGLMRALAAELAPAVRVNAVAPSLTATPLAAPLTRNEQMAKAIAGMHAIPRLGEPDDIAAAAAFLLSPDSGWITGQVLGVDGGRSTLRTKG
ncbi:MAG: SDR family oxidoreductase [Alphaproteobacteria bacterium]|nr:SDR family oxidoreductase [Alphaproteobacteria bacterium]